MPLSVPLFLEDERSRLAAEASGHSLDADEARLVLTAGGLRKLGRALALHVAGEVLDNADTHQR